MVWRRKNPVLVTAGALAFSMICCAWAVEPINIRVYPKVLNLNSEWDAVMVHTDMLYSNVDPDTVTLNGIEISDCKPDNQGHFVAKFAMDEIKDLPLNVGEYNTLTLAGETWSEVVFSGSTDVLVVKSEPPE